MRVRLAIARTRQSATRFDLVLSGAVAAVLVAYTWVADAEPGRKGFGTAVALSIGAALFWRRRAAVVVGVTVSGLVGLYELVVGEAGTVLIVPYLIAFYSIGAYTGRRGSVVGFGLTYAATVLGLLADPDVRDVAGNALFVAIVAGSAWAGGVAVRTNRARAAELADLAAQLERERDEKARLAVAAERGRIARELHDVVAHGISVIAVQAGAGRHALGSEPRRAHAAFAAIEDTARQALAEMRHMLGLLRERDEPTTAAPLPGLADRDKLIEQARADGLSVDVEVEGEPRPLAAGVDLAAFRILQEALTNARKHAPGARTQVRIRYDISGLEIEVRNGTPSPNSRPTSASGGQGLIGMRERVALYGGKFEAGSLAGGGFSVKALLSLEQDRT
ncbi:MAG TPA: histidine kinase [Jiangellaceae bacterium]|nr:histidine kinase [Jiangellaceae bacterium]